MRKILLLCIIFLFLFLRFYKITTSLFFINDMGRDLLVLQEWQEKGKPPLLGPQTSALPINQSPIYFYSLYPFFLLTNGSPYTALFANAFLYLSFFLISYYLFSKKFGFLTLFSIFFLISIHPQLIIQNRFIWNPSFVTPFIVIGLLAFLSKKNYLVGLALAIATSLSYSVAPLTIAVLLAYLIYAKKDIFKLLISFGIGLFFLNLPIFIFEIKYKFQLTKALFSRGIESQVIQTYLDKTKNLSQLLFSADHQTISLLLFLFFISAASYSLFKSKNRYQRIISFIFLVTLLITIFSPIAIQSHYIFGVTSLIFIYISLLPKKLLLPITTILIIIFFQKNLLDTYFKPAPRSFNQMYNCFQKVCRDIKSPVFISLGSSYLPFHYGPEQHYIAKKAGCNVKKLENGTNQTNTMLVVADGGNYQQGKSTYFELSQFGPSKLINSYICQSNFKVYEIIKSD